MKHNPLEPNRLLKYIKNTLDKASKEEKLIEEAFENFKKEVEEDTSNATSKAAMIDCLKLLQSSKATIAKLVTAAEKINTNSVKKSSSKNEEFEDEDLFKTL